MTNTEHTPTAAPSLRELVATSIAVAALPRVDRLPYVGPEGSLRAAIAGYRTHPSAKHPDGKASPRDAEVTVARALHRGGAPVDVLRAYVTVSAAEDPGASTTLAVNGRMLTLPTYRFTRAVRALLAVIDPEPGAGVTPLFGLAPGHTALDALPPLVTTEGQS